VKLDVISNDILTTNNNDLKEKSEIYKIDGMGDESVKINIKDVCFKIIYFFTSFNLEKDLPSLCNDIIIYILSIHNLFFYNALLFSDKTISRRYYLKYKHDIKYLLTKEYDRILLVFFICKAINTIFISLLEYSQEKLYLVSIIENEINYKNEHEIFILNQKEIKKKNYSN
jgi:hypothetical protein